MFTYRPKGVGRDLPLVVVLHGCGQRAEPFARQAGWLTLADRYGFVVVAAEQSLANNPNRCFNWFEPRDARRGQGEAASIAAMVAHAVQTQGVDPNRVFVTGLSAGGAMTAVMLAAYPDLFAAGAVVAGVPYGVAQGVGAAMGLMHAGSGRTAAALGDLVRGAGLPGLRPPRITIWHGDADRVVRLQNAADLASQWVDAHGLPPEGLSDALPNRSRTTWRADPSERPTIELNIVQGLGHGTPLSTLGEAGLGSQAPHMLEAGVSSSLEIAEFWGLADPGAAAADQAARPASGEHALHPVGQQVATGIFAAVRKALKRAGLVS